MKASESGGYLSPRSVVPLIGKSGLRIEGHMLRSYSLLTPQCSTIGDAVSLPCALSAALAPLRCLLPLPAPPLSALSPAPARRRRAHRRPPRATPMRLPGGLGWVLGEVEGWFVVKNLWSLSQNFSSDHRERECNG